MRLSLTLLIMALVSACATAPPGEGGSTKPDTGQRPASGAPGSDRYHLQQDTAPRQRRDVTQLPEPTPRPEPPSRYGNPDSYTVWGKTYHVLPSAEGYVAEGRASWYGRKFHGFRTSSGETFDMYRFTAAHRTLPLPTYARVTNLENGKSLVVRINDRGPFHEDRIIDLSWAAAVRLGIEEAGTGRVRVKALTPQTRQVAPGNSVPTAVRAAVDSPPPEDRQLFLQAGAFRQQEAARRLKARLQRRLGLGSEIRQGERFFRVWLGPYEDRRKRRQARQTLEQAGFETPMAVESN